ncbi:hypothetical protein [Streptomyces sp. NPDC088812]|uniref:hypothetical protein n=1 Tax=Streptomyces sp. NPDC088812 TaxID=3365905 RepID=UPI0037FAF463
MTSTPVSTPTANGVRDGFREAAPGRLRSAPRGRHRRSRPRRALFAAAGLVLAAAVLGVVRLSPDPGVGSAGPTGAVPRPTSVPGPSAAPGTGRPADAAAIGAVGAVAPTAPGALGGTNAGPAAPHTPSPGIPGARPSVAHTPAVPGVAPASTAPRASVTPTSPAPAPVTTTGPRPTAVPAPPPAPSTAPPAPLPRPQPPGRPGLCVPVVGLCVDPFGS